MDDRDKGLTHLFVRDLDEIPLPLRGEWRRAPRGGTAMRASRLLLGIGALAAVVAIALIVGFQLNERQSSVAGPSSSPSPRDTAIPVLDPRASATPTASHTPAATVATDIFNDDFGFAFREPQDRLTFRAESSQTRGADFSIGGFAVSADGRRMVYWTEGATEAAGAPQELRVVSAGDPTHSQTLVTLKSGQMGGGIVWSNDAGGVMFAVIDLNPVPGPPGSSAAAASIHTVDVGGTSLFSTDRVIYRSQQGGVVLQPVAWDRPAGVLAFGETGEGGFMFSYDVTHFSGSDVTTTRANVPVQITMSSVSASSDAKYVVGIDLTAQGFTYWPLQTMSGAGHHPPESKYGMTGAVWRPGTHEIGFVGPSNQFWLCDVDHETPLGCGRTAFSGLPDGAGTRAFRADGSAVVLTVGPSGPTTTYLLVRIGTDAKSRSGDRVTFQDNGNLVSSVRFR